MVRTVTLLGWCVLAAAQVKPVTSQEALAVFQEVNEKKELFGPLFGRIVEYYKALAEEHCSGLRLADGTRVSLESRGEDYGLFTIEDSKNIGLVGFLHTDRPVRLSGVRLPKGLHLLFAGEERLIVHSGERREPLALKTPIDPQLLHDKGARLKLSLAVQAGRAALVAGENQLPLQSAPPAAKPAAQAAAQ